MSPYSLGALITSITSLALGLLVYFKQRERLVNRSFMWAMLSVAIWSFGYFGMTSSTHKEEAIWFIRYMLNAGAIFVPVLFLNFVLIVLGRDHGRLKILGPFWGAAFLFIILDFTPWFFSKVEPSLGFKFFIHAGPTYPAFVIFFLVVAFYGFYLLQRGYQEASGLKRNQLKYLFWTWLIGLAAGASTFLPTMDVDVQPWPIYLIPICLAAEAYSIVKYRSMDINIVFRRGMVYSILLPLITGGFLILLISIENLYKSYVNYPFVVTAIAAFILAIAFQPLKNQVQVWVDSYFFKGAYDYHHTLRKTSEAMTSILNLERLADHLLSSIIADMRVTTGSLLLMSKERRGLYLLSHRVHASHRKPEPPSFLPNDSAIVKTLEWLPATLMREGIKDQFPPLQGEGLSQEMTRLGTDLAIPVTLQKQLRAILLLGSKLSGDPFSEEDLELLSTLANQAAVAIENARLYDEVTSIKEYLENILRNLESGVITIDQGGRITTFNRAAETMTQWKASEVLERDCRILEETLAQLLLFTLASGEGQSGVELTLHNKVGKPFPVGATSSLLQNQQGNLLGAITLFSDLTEVKELEKEKWKADKLAYIGTLAASIAHEIKNPLVSIKTLAQLLPERHADVEFRDHFSRIALKEVDRIDLLVSQMLDLKEDSSPPQFENLHAEEILEEILLLLSKEIEKQNIKVERAYHPGGPVISGDRSQLKQAFWNVILNSVQAMEGGGILTVSTFLSTDGKKSEDAVVLKISDTGPGIPGDQIGKIFDPFFTTKRKGAGLGLSICYKIINEHRGSIQVESQVKRGTSLSISLPAIQS